MRTIYYPQDDILEILLSDKPVAREVSQDWNVNVSHTADGSVVELVILDAVVRKPGPQLRALLDGNRSGESLAGNAVEQILCQLESCGGVELDDFFVQGGAHVTHPTEMEGVLQHLAWIPSGVGWFVCAEFDSDPDLHPRLSGLRPRNLRRYHSLDVRAISDPG